MDERSITIATGLLPPRRQKLIRMYCRLSESERINLHAEQEMLVSGRKIDWPHSQESLAYCMLIIALQERYQMLHAGELRHAKPDKLEKAEQVLIDQIKAKRNRSRTGDKRDLLLMHLPLIRKLYEVDKLSWREIAAYLGERCNLALSHAYVNKVYNECQLYQPTRFERKPTFPNIDPGPNGTSVGDGEAGW